MKTRRSALWLVITVGVSVLLLVWFGLKKPMEVLPSTLAGTSAPLASMELPVELGQGQATPPLGTNTLPTRAVTSTNAPALPVQSGADSAREGLSTLNDVPIVFYGKLEDQFSNAVANAAVNFSIRVYSGFRSGVDRGQVSSDANGLFTISGYKGESISVVPRKDGYVPVSMKGSGIYSYMWPEEQRAHPDPNKPVVIKMWKLQGAEPLVGIDQRYKLQFSNAPIHFDLITGKSVPSGGDLAITVDRPAGIVSQRQPQDWGLKIEGVDGGLIETSFAEGRITYQAPENGYQPSNTIAISTTNHWSDLVQRMFFVNSRNGQVYSKIFLSLRINASPDESASVTFRGAANTNGSRNWEATVPRE